MKAEIILKDSQGTFCIDDFEYAKFKGISFLDKPSNLQNQAPLDAFGYSNLSKTPVYFVGKNKTISVSADSILIVSFLK